MYAMPFTFLVPIGMYADVITFQVVPSETHRIFVMVRPVANAEQFIDVPLVGLADVIPACVGKHHVIPMDLHSCE
jgi:hypothetical protein